MPTNNGKPAPSDEWYTSAQLVQGLAGHYADGAFSLDAAATAASGKAPRFYDAETDARIQDWHHDAAGGAVWCNPPYSNTAGFLEKAATTAQQGATVVCLIPARTDTAYWHDLVLAKAAEVLLVGDRITLTRPDGSGAAGA